jgi:arginyl-tRNA synthetase
MLRITEHINRSLMSAFPNLPHDRIILRPTPNLQMGDIGINTIPIAEALNYDKAQITEQVAETLRQVAYVQEVQIKGHFVNIFIQRHLLTIDLCRTIRDDELYGSSRTGLGHPVLIEHTSINPNASPHVGRGRNALIGDCLARMLRFEQFNVEVHYYVNDLGKQIALLVLESRGKSQVSFDDMLALYVAANERASADPAFENQAFALLQRFEGKDPDVMREFMECTSVCLQGQLQVLSRLGIHYDYFDRESDFVHDPSLVEVFERLRVNNALFTDEHGREVIDLKVLGFEMDEGRYFVLRRANSSSMYGYRDIAYTLYKLRRCPENNIVVLGQDHAMYFSQLALILQVANVKPPELVTYSHILLKEGKMSTRKGSVILLSDFLDEAITRSKARVDISCQELDETERTDIAKIVGVGAVKFSILRITPQSNVIFDWEQALTFEGDSAPYIQYCCARMASILRRYGREVEHLDQMEFEVGDEEWQLTYRLSEFPSAVQQALAKRSPSILATYALDVAKLFNRFYRACPVLQVEQNNQKIFRLNLCLSTHKVLSRTLGLLGIEVPERM